MYRQNGFTLIELVIVIVILGILSATAIPKFISLSSDARIAVMHGLKGALEDGANLVYAKAQIEGVADESSTTITINDVEVNIAYGYPQSWLLSSYGFEADLVAWLSLDADSYTTNATTEWLLTDDTSASDGISLGTNNSGDAVGFILNDYQDENCGVVYLGAQSADDTPTITVYDSGC